jgi:hypothetical protein
MFSRCSVFHGALCFTVLHVSGCPMLQGAPCFRVLYVFTVLHLAGALRGIAGILAYD